MSTKEFKSPPARLARLFRAGRDRWKARAADKQRTIKKMRITVRDLTASRDHWKDLARQQAAHIDHLREQLAQAQQEPHPGGR
jgi:hypothetical protein